MKNTLILILLLSTVIFSANAQHTKESREKIRVLKIAFLTEQLALTSNEAEKFWPIYNAFDKERNELRMKQRKEMGVFPRNKIAIELLSDKEAKKIIYSKLAIDKKLFESQQRFIQKIKGVISYKKIIKLQTSEMEFGRKLLKRYHQKRF